MKSILSFLCFIFFLHISMASSLENGPVKIGWESTEITPDQPFILAGQFHARIAEGVLDPLTATVLVIESEISDEKAILISCDLVAIDDGVRENRPDHSFLQILKTKICDIIPEISEDDIVVNATHTHTAPRTGISNDWKNQYGVDMGDDIMTELEFSEYASDKITEAVKSAWSNKKRGGISFGLTHAVVGRNRIQTGFDGVNQMYGNTNRPELSHIQGYEDHSVQLLCTWDENETLTGMMINIPCPSQVSEQLYQATADFWHEIRLNLRQEYGDDLFVLPQCGAAGDQSPHFMYDGAALTRMQKLQYPDLDSGRSSMALRKQIANDVTSAIGQIMPVMEQNKEWNIVFQHEAEKIDVQRRLIGSEDLKMAEEGVKEWESRYKNELAKLDTLDKSQNKRWYVPATQAYSRMNWFKNVYKRAEIEKKDPKVTIQMHVIRIGDVAIATNPFELYVDFGIRMKARSKAVQTFIVQLAGGGTYLPPERAIKGGGYGSVASSNMVGPEGGQELVEHTIRMIDTLWE